MVVKLPFKDILVSCSCGTMLYNDTELHQQVQQPSIDHSILFETYWALLKAANPRER